MSLPHPRRSSGIALTIALLSACPEESATPIVVEPRSGGASVSEHVVDPVVVAAEQTVLDEPR
jgi:hypothetical protein